MKLNRKRKKDLFVHTQRKLTFTYTWIIIIFLVLFSLIVSGFFIAMIYQDQRQTLRSALYETEDGKIAIPDLSESRGEDLYYKYVIDYRGNLLAGSEAFPQLSNVSRANINRWHPPQEEFRLMWQSAAMDLREIRRIIDKDRLLLVGAQSVMMADGTPATIYAAKDVTFYYEVLRSLLIVFIVILVIFVIASLWLSYKMSKKAMIPIQRTYRLQQQFLADASHELRTPLSIINTSLDVIELENGEDFTSYTKEVVSDMKEEVGRMSRMVQHLLMLARSDSGSVEFEMVSFDLVPKLRQWTLSFEAVAQKTQIKLNTQLPEEMAVKGDIERIKQLIYILLDNAIKYTPENGTVHVTLGSTPKHWFLSVQDSGIGIPVEDQLRIFDRFYRVEKHRSREEGSAGLGLSIAKWIVEAHHGFIGVKSAPGEGSTFILKFPHK